MDASPALFALLDPGGRILGLNPALAAAAPDAPRAAESVAFVEHLLSEADRPGMVGLLARTAERGQGFVTETRLLGGAAQEGVVVEWHGGPVLTSDGEVQAMTLIGVPSKARAQPGPGVDPTAAVEEARRALREIQTRLIDVERLDAAGELAARLAHSIGNPLAALLGTAEIAFDASSVKDPVLHRVLRLGQRIQRVIDRTLQLFPGAPPSLTEQEPGWIVADVVTELEARAAARGVVLSARVEPDLPAIRADRGLLAGALLRIGENALEAIGESGGLEVEAASLARGGGVVFRIIDSGKGMTRETRASAFEPFFTTKGGAAGLGLPVARGVVQGHQGRIRLEERPGGGTVVSIELPLRKKVSPS